MRKVSSWLLLAAVLLPGCGRGQEGSNVRVANTTGAVVARRAATPAAHVETALVRAEGIDAALSAASAYLLELQSEDGAWRSDVYGPFKNGDALTALVVTTLLDMAALPDDEPRRAAIDKAAGYLVEMVDDDGAIRSPEFGLAYPVYTAAGAVIALSRLPDADPHHAARDAWLVYLRERQLAEPVGWHPDDGEYGGWGYAADLPRKPAAGQPLGNLAEPNLSATVFALGALRAAGVPADDPSVQKALAFLGRCQNLETDPKLREDSFDDGGFHFMLGDPVRNKAGVVGVDRRGRPRFASYGSATADGLRALMLCGAPHDDPRAVAARRWLVENFSAEKHPGDYAHDREGARPAVYFYYCESLAHALATDEDSRFFGAEDTTAWASALSSALITQQRGDGSWRNAAVDVREDDPLVATSLAASALAHCRTILARRQTMRSASKSPKNP